MASSSTSSVQKSFKYDVFLSFRGEDTRKTFVDHLYCALEQKGIYTYKDDEKIKKGKRIDDQLITSIEDSRFYIVVFSKKYASSSWCLDELVKIMECQKMNEHTAYIVFYDVEPTEIRKQVGSVGEAFSKYEKEETARKWRAALQQAAGLAGWELKTTANGHEAKLIQKIVEEISPKVLCNNLSVDRKLVGMDARVNGVVSSLHIDTNDVRMIGIKGMGGSGKTTLARAIFDRILMQFEGSSFVENVREVSNDPSNGLKSLQKQVLLDVLNDQRISVSGVADGKNKLKIMLRRKKVLVVLDDVDRIDQLEALAGEPNWFKPGTRIIITTRDEKVLLVHQVDFIIDVNLLSFNEAMGLFSRYAFGKEIPNQGYEELSKEVVCYAAGLPLTLKVLGSFLCGESGQVWRDVLERLKTIPLEETLKILEISYNGLADDYKEIFLDVACMLKGWKKDEAIRALESRGFHAEIGLRVLEQKSLITISKYGYLGMHDHIEEMGKNIVRRLHHDEPHKHSRLWINMEIEVILAKDLGTEATRCIYLVNSKLHPTTIMEGLRKMKGLRFLHLKECETRNHNFFLERWKSHVFSQYLPHSLQYLSWNGYPFTCLPKNFQANNIVQLQMRNSNIRQLWEGGERKVLDKVTYIDLFGSKLRTLELGPTPNLETLNIGGCNNLVELHMHGETPKLKFLDISCTSVRIIYLGRSPNLEVLSLEGCNDLEELHMPIGSVKLKFLDLFHYAKLRTLNLRQTLNLEKLDILGCDNLVELHMPTELKYLCLEYSRLRTLDLAHVRNLEEIVIIDCKDMEELIMPVESLKLRSLRLIGTNLRIVDVVRTSNLKTLHPHQCVDWTKLHMPVESLKLKTLQFSNPKFSNLDLARFANLHILYLCRCDHLVELQLQALWSVRCLKELALWGSFPHVPKDLHQLECLEKLTLSSEKIKHLPNSICMLKHLKVLKLNNCYLLEQLPEDLGRLECLEELSLSSKVIKHLPNGICMLKHLKILKLKYCYLLERLPEDLGGLECLETLGLRDCVVLQDIPNSICELKHLKKIQLRFCILVEKLPEELGRLKCLKELDIEGAGITHLPFSIFQLIDLRINGSMWRLESYGFTAIKESYHSRYSAWCYALA